MAISSINSVNTGAYQSSYNASSAPAAEPRTVEPADTSIHSQAEVADATAKTSALPAFEISEDGSESSSAQNVTDVLKKAVEDINKNAGNSEALFAVHEATNRIMIKIVDRNTKEVIKEFPPEKTLDLIAKAWELAGLTVDERR